MNKLKTMLARRISPILLLLALSPGIYVFLSETFLDGKNLPGPKEMNSLIALGYIEWVIVHTLALIYIAGLILYYSLNWVKSLVQEWKGLDEKQEDHD